MDRYRSVTDLAARPAIGTVPVKQANDDRAKPDVAGDLL